MSWLSAPKALWGLVTSQESRDHVTPTLQFMLDGYVKDYRYLYIYNPSDIQCVFHLCISNMSIAVLQKIDLLNATLPENSHRSI